MISCCWFCYWVVSRYLVGVSAAVVAHSSLQFLISLSRLLRKSPLIPSRSHAWLIFAGDQVLYFAICFSLITRLTPFICGVMLWWCASLYLVLFPSIGRVVCALAVLTESSKLILWNKAKSVRRKYSSSLNALYRLTAGNTSGLGSNNKPKNLKLMLFRCFWA